jgi:hypothetical protein
MEEHVKLKLGSEEEEINAVIKPEYLKNSAVDNINVSSLNVD